MDVLHELRFRNFTNLRDQWRRREDAEGLRVQGEVVRMATFLNISAQYLSHINNRRKPIGNATARKIEQAFKLPTGWLDTENLGGTVILDTKAREFGQMAMRLYLQDPEGVRNALMEYMEKRMNLAMAQAAGSTQLRLDVGESVGEIRGAKEPRHADEAKAKAAPKAKP